MPAARRAGQGWPSAKSFTTHIISRPFLDLPEHGGRLGRVGINRPVAFAQQRTKGKTI